MTIEDKEVAAELSKQLLEVYMSLNKAAMFVQEHCPRDEFEGFRVEAARVAGGLYGLLEPLWRAHPDLAPEGLEFAKPRKKNKR